MSVEVIDITPIVTVVEVPYTVIVPGGVVPVSTSAPAWGAGVYQDGETVDVTAGTYGGTAPISVARSVERWDGAAWVQVATGVGSTYTFGAAGDHRIVEVATNAPDPGGITTTSSTVTVYASGALPIATTPPETTADGGLDVGDVVGTCGAVWDGQGAEITGYVYRYLRDGSPIAGATSSTYTLTADDQGTELTPQVAGVSSVGTGAWVSADTVAVPAAAVETGPIYPGTLTLLATDDPAGTLVGSPIFEADGTIEAVVAAGGVQATSSGAWLFFALERRQDGTPWPENLDITGDAMGPFAVGVESDPTPLPTGVRVLSGFASGVSARPTAYAAIDDLFAGGLETPSAGDARAALALRYMGGGLSYDTTGTSSTTAQLGSIASGGILQGVRSSGETQTRQGRMWGSTLYDVASGATLRNEATNGSSAVGYYVVAAVIIQRATTLASDTTIRFRPILRGGFFEKGPA